MCDWCEVRDPTARFSRPLLSLVRRMLCVEPDGRPDINEVLRVCKARRCRFNPG